MTPLERFRSALETQGSRREGPHGWQCPAHQDARASLSVTEGKDGRVLLQCHAGCDSKDVVAALGLTMADLYPEDPARNGRAAKAIIVATYDYTDEHGTLLYQVVRMAPKSFRQRHPDGHGAWIWKMQGVRRVLYHLPKLLAAKASGQQIWVAEGEKDVHALEQAGVTATCNPMGAGKWRTEYTQTLAGATVVIVADSDDAGRKHAADVTASLKHAGCTVRIVEAAEGKDATDHLTAGKTLNDFRPVDAATFEQAAAPAPTVQELVDVLSSYQHLDDPGHVWFALAVGISGFAFDGEPLWGMLVGSPSSGKTETARSLGAVAGHIDDLTASALLSWTKGKEPRPTGVLTRIGKRGMVTIGDFSTVLAMSNKGGRDLLFAMLRRVYDGHLTRDLGTAPEQLRWDGRLTILACCTPIIDDYSSHADALGPRWLYYRIRDRSTEGKRAMGLASRIPALEGRNRAAELVEALIQSGTERARNVHISDTMHAALVDLAIVCCYGRAAVPRSGYGRREITGMAIIEDPPRLVKQLRQLIHATLALGATEAFAYDLARRAALDSIPQVRRKLLEILAGSSEQHAVSDLARTIGCDRKVARYALEELAAAGLMSFPTAYDNDEEGRGDQFTPRTWTLDGPDNELIAAVFTGSPWDEKVVVDLSSLSGETRAREGTLMQPTFRPRDGEPEQGGFEFADGPVGACVTCGRECYSTDADGKPRHPLCEAANTRKYTL